MEVPPGIAEKELRATVRPGERAGGEGWARKIKTPT